MVICAQCQSVIRATPLEESEAAEPVQPSAGLEFVSSPEASNVVSLSHPHARAIEQAKVSGAQGGIRVPEDRCPKCIEPRRGRPICSRCGLSFESVSADVFEPPRWLAEAWLELLQHWGEEERHRALLGTAMASGDLGGLGRLYRIRLAEMPHDPIAASRLEEVIGAAAAPLDVTPHQEKWARVAYWLKIAVAAAVSALCVAATGLMLARMRTP